MSRILQTVSFVRDCNLGSISFQARRLGSATAWAEVLESEYGVYQLRNC